MRQGPSQSSVSSLALSRRTRIDQRPTRLQRTCRIIRSLALWDTWQCLVALSWIASTERTLDGSGLLAVVAADNSYNSPRSAFGRFHIRVGPSGKPCTSQLLRKALIVSSGDGQSISRGDARVVLNSLVRGFQKENVVRMHEAIATTCLRCLETNEPEAIIQPLRSDKCRRTKPNSSDPLLEYAKSYWHVHFRCAEKLSRHLCSLLHRILRLALRTAHESTPPDSSHIILTGMRMCVEYDLSVLGRTYVEMGAPLGLDESLQTTILHQVCCLGSIGVIDAILERRPDLTIADNEGLTALHQAVLHGHPNIIRKMLDAGSSPNLQSTASGDSTLHMAVRNDKIEIVAILLSSGADPSIKNFSGETPAQAAAYQNNHPIFRLLSGHSIEDSAGTPAQFEHDMTSAFEILSLRDRDGRRDQQKTSGTNPSLHISVYYSI